MMDAEFDTCTAYGLKAGTHPEETSQAPEATNTGGATVSTRRQTAYGHIASSLKYPKNSQRKC